MYVRKKRKREKEKAPLAVGRLFTLPGSAPGAAPAREGRRRAQAYSSSAVGACLRRSLLKTLYYRSHSLCASTQDITGAVLW